jgi:tetratricopeptide (TPR) repeat protein
LKVDIQKYFPYVVFALAVLLYFPTLKHQYAWDDSLVIHGNELTKKGFSGLSEIWTSARYIEDRPTYRPIPQTLFAIEWAMTPNNPRLAHFTNIILYGLCCLMLFSLLKRWFSGYSPYLIVFISMLFVLHPVHTEVVANIKSRDEILAALFVLLSLNYLSIWNQSGKKLHLFLVFSFLFFGALSKISALTVFPLLVLYLFLRYSYTIKSLFNALNEVFFKRKIEIISLGVQVIVYTFALLLFPNIITLANIVAFSLIFNWRYLNPVLRWGLICISLVLLFFAILKTIILIFSILVIFYLFKNNGNRKEILFFNAILIFLYLPFHLFFGLNAIAPVLLAIFFSIFILLPDRYLKFGIFFPWVVLVGYVLATVFVATFDIHSLILILFFCFVMFLYSWKINEAVKIIYWLGVGLIVASTFINFYELSTVKNFPDVPEVETVINVEDDNESFRMLINQPYFNILVAAENLPEKFATIARVQWLYIQKLFYPHPLVHQYGAWQIELAGFKNWDVWFSIIIHVLLITFVIMRIRKKCPVAMGILFYLVTVSIYTNIIYLMPDTMAERFLFLPSVGFCVALVFGLYQLGDKWLPKNAIAFTGIVLLPVMIFFAQKTWSRSKDWKDNYTLTANTIPFAPNNAVINAQYGAELKKKLYSYPDEFDNHADVLNKIEFHFKRAVELYADFYSANSDLGVFYIEQRRINDAFPYLRKATELNPEKWINHYYLSLIYFEREEYFKAMNGFRAVIDHQDENITEEERTNAYEYLARSYFKLNKPNELKQSLVENYEKHGVKSSMILAGNMLAQKGKIDDALEIFYRLKGDFPGDESINSTIEYLLQFK